MKKWFAIALVIAALGFAGYKAGMNYLSSKMIDQVLSQEESDRLLQDPEIQRIIQQQSDEQNTHAPQTDREKMDAERASPDRSSEEEQMFTSKEEALSFLLSKFSMSELTRYAAKATNGTAEDRKALQAELMSRLTPEEFEALKIIGLQELSNRQ